ncbi:MAG: S8 family peptidase [Candidatus Firestonebacteria bacterium]|nr:S8 family peptidase [Candidatus Firestonebacteria bacterium]
MNNINIKSLFVFILNLFFIYNCIILINKPVRAQEPENIKLTILQQIAIQHIAQKHQIPERNLRIVNKAVLSEFNITSFKVFDEIDGNIFGVDLDNVGNIVDAESIIKKLWQKGFIGKIEEPLYKLLMGLNNSDKVTIGIWLKSKSKSNRIKSEEFKDDTVRDLEDKKFREEYGIEMENLQKPIVSYLKERGHKISTQSRLAPLIFAEVSKEDILALEKDNNIEAVYLQRICLPAMNSAAPTERADVVWNRGIKGAGVNVAVVEMGSISNANTYLGNIIYEKPYQNSSNHTTAVAGIIASTHSTYKGISYNVKRPLLSANSGSGYETSIINATEWAINQNANVINYSFAGNSGGYMTALDRYADHVIWTHYRTIIVAAGNIGQHCSSPNYYVGFPSIAYNVMSVGAIDDMDNTNLNDDIVAGYSCYGNPITPYMQREKPEIAAVGSRINSTIGTGVDYAGDGTSFATPQVSGGAALLMSRNSTLTIWPEAIKAILMASAVHPTFISTFLNYRVGAGVIDLSVADSIVSNNRYMVATKYSSNPNFEYSFYVNYGQKFSVFLVWDSHPDNNHPPTGDPLQTDYDMILYSPDGVSKLYSFSIERNFEYVRYTANQTGWWKVKVSAFKFDGSYEYIGLAWTTY